MTSVLPVWSLGNLSPEANVSPVAAAHLAPEMRKIPIAFNIMNDHPLQEEKERGKTRLITDGILFKVKYKPELNMLFMGLII